MPCLINYYGQSGGWPQTVATDPKAATFGVRVFVLTGFLYYVYFDVTASYVPAGDGKISLNLNELDFAVKAKETKPTTLGLAVKNIGNAGFDWTANIAPGSPWLSIDKAKGSTAAGGSSPVNVTVDPSTLATGTYNSSIDFATGTNKVTLKVVVTVSAAVTPDSISLTDIGSTDQIFYSDDPVQVPATTISYAFGSADHANLSLEVWQPPSRVVANSESYLVHKGDSGGQRIYLTFVPTRPPDEGSTLFVVGVLRDDAGNLLLASAPVTFKWLVKTGQVIDLRIDPGQSTIGAGSRLPTPTLTYTLFHHSADAQFDINEFKADGKLLRRTLRAVFSPANQGNGVQTTNFFVNSALDYVHTDASSAQLVAHLDTADGQSVFSKPVPIPFTKVRIASVSTAQNPGVTAQHGSSALALPASTPVPLIVNCEYATGDAGTGTLLVEVTFYYSDGTPFGTNTAQVVVNGSGTRSLNLTGGFWYQSGGRIQVVAHLFPIGERGDNGAVDTLEIPRVFDPLHLQVGGGKTTTNLGVLFDQVSDAATAPPSRDATVTVSPDGIVDYVVSRFIPTDIQRSRPAAQPTDAATANGVGPSDFLPIGRLWTFDPPVAANGSFGATVTFSYSAPDLPDDPNFSEAGMQILSYDPAAGAFHVYPTTVDTTARTATARIDRIDAYFTLAALGPFQQVVLDSTLPIGAGVFSGLTTLINTGSAAVNLNASVYTRPADSTQRSWTGNSASTTLAPKAQTSTASSPDLSPLVTPAGGWLQLASNSTSVVGATLLANRNGMDALPMGTPSSALVFTAAETDGTTATTLYLTNPSLFPATAQLNLYDPTGAQVDQASVEIAAKGQFSDSIDNLFQNTPPPYQGYVTVRASQRLAGSSAWISRGVITALAAQQPSAVASRLYAPAALAGNGQTTRLSVINASGQDTNLTLRAIADTGTPVGQPMTLALAAGAQLWSDLSLFNFPANAAVSGWIQVDSTNPGIMGDVAFGTAQARADLPMTPLLSTSGILPVLLNDGTNLTTAVTLVNPNSTAAKAQVAVMDANGKSVGSGSVALAANARMTTAISTLTPQAAGMTGGYLAITSDKGVIGYESLLQPGKDFAAIPIQPASANPQSGGGGNTAPTITLSLNSLNFGTVTVGKTSDLSLTIGNTGTAPLTVSGIVSSNPAFILTQPSVPFTVTAGATVATTIRFTPASATSFSGTLTVTSNDAVNGIQMVSLTGTGIAQPPGNLACGFTLGTDISAKWLALGGQTGLLGCPTGNETEAPVSPLATTGRTANFKTTGGTPGAIFWHRTYDFASQAYETHGQIYTAYAAPAVGGAAVIGFPISDEYSINGGRRSDFEQGYAVLNSSTGVAQMFYSSFDFTARYSTTFGTMNVVQRGLDVSGAYSLNNGTMTGVMSGLTLTGTWKDDTGSGKISLVLAADGSGFNGTWTRSTGSGNPGGAWNGTWTPTAPLASVLPARIDFGTVSVGQFKEMSLLVEENSDAAALSVTSAASSNGAFRVTSALPLSVPHGNVAGVAARFTPAAAGPFSATITFATNDPLQPSISVAVVGTGR